MRNFSVSGKCPVAQLISWKTHVFRRDGPDEIVAVPVVANAPQLGQKRKEVSLKKNLGLVGALIRNALLNYLVDGLKRSVLNYDPIRFVARDDVLPSCMPSGVSCPDWLSVRLLYDVAVRPVYFFKHEPFIVAALDVRTTRIIERTVGDLLQSGFSPIGHYVTKRVAKYEDPRISARADLVGRVASVQGSTLLLEDSKDGITSIEAAEVWIEKRSFVSCLVHAFPNCHAADSVVSELGNSRL